MSSFTAKNYSSTTYTTTRPEPVYRTVLIEPPKKPSNKPRTNGQWTRPISNSQSGTKPTASIKQRKIEQVTTASYSAREPSTVKSPPPKNHTIGNSEPKEKAAAAKQQPSHQNSDLNKQQTSDHPISKLSCEPKVYPQTSVETLRIPCDNSPCRITYIPLTAFNPRDTGSDDCMKKEEWLTRFPNVKLMDQSTFSWNERQLLYLPFKDLDRFIEGFHLLYVCYEKKTRLPRNRYLEKLSGVHMYGDSFLFKMSNSYASSEPDYLPLRVNPSEAQESGGKIEVMLKEILS